MSGHSKWATIKHKKGAADKARGKLFNKIARQLEVAARDGGGDATTNASLRSVILKAKAAQMTNDAIDRAIKRGTGEGAADKARGKLFAKIARQIEVSAKSGGGDIDSNPTLRTAVAKARAARMTNDAIDRAIKRGTGEAGGETYESITYEGYAPGGVALLIDVLTDNRNRTGAEVRSVFTKMGGSMAEPGAVGWQFTRRGVVMVEGVVDEDKLMEAALEAGADDIVDDGGVWRVMTAPSVAYDVKDALEAEGFTVESADTPMVSDNLVPVTSVEDARKILRIMEAIEDNDDVQDVYSNFDIADDVMEAAAG